MGGECEAGHVGVHRGLRRGARGAQQVLVLQIRSVQDRLWANTIEHNSENHFILKAPDKLLWILGNELIKFSRDTSTWVRMRDVSKIIHSLKKTNTWNIRRNFNSSDTKIRINSSHFLLRYPLTFTNKFSADRPIFPGQQKKFRTHLPK